MITQTQDLKQDIKQDITWILPPDEIEYPESDGEPMAETDAHRDLIANALIHPLREHFKERDDVYVSGNLFLYYEQGKDTKVAPDVFVVFGLPNQQRRIYRTWEEGRVPDVVFELTSKSTHNEDLTKKKDIYESLGIKEYFLFDPYREKLDPALKGFRLQGGQYGPIPVQVMRGGEWQVESKVLALNLRTAGDRLRLYSLETGRYLLNSDEEADARREAEQGWRLAEERVVYEVKNRRLTEQKLAEAESELVRLKALLKGQEAKEV